MTDQVSNGFVLLRQDEKGNDFVVDTFSTQEEADRAQEKFEKRGHKQAYRVEGLDALIQRLRGVICMTDEDRERQRRSFAYGNLKIGHPDVTRADIDQAADRLAGKRTT